MKGAGLGGSGSKGTREPHDGVRTGPESCLSLPYMHQGTCVLHKLHG